MKKLIWWIEDKIWAFRCEYGLWLHGPYGLSRVIERMPFRFIVKYVRKYGATIGQNCHIERGIDIHRPFGKSSPFENLVIGDNVYLGHNLLVDLSRKVTIHNSASIGSRVQIWTHSGYYSGSTVDSRGYGENYGEVIIESGAIVYSGSLIKHGVTIGSFASITACSMVNMNVEPYSYATGVPIRVIKKDMRRSLATELHFEEKEAPGREGKPPPSKTIMIFGAGIGQLELIHAARELNYSSVVLDPQKEPIGKSYADFFYQVDAKDLETTRMLANKHKIDGIVTGQMENPLRLMSQLAIEEGYIFHTPEVTERCLDKWLMKQAFLKANVPCAKGIMVDPDSDISSTMMEGLAFPMILKPRDAFSSRGVYKVNSLEEIKAHIEETRSFASKKFVLIEEFLEGREFSIESITYQGITEIIQFTEKFITPYPNTVEMAHLQPAALNIQEQEHIAIVVKAGIEALGIKNSAAHSEVMLTSKGPYIIEIGARLGGDFISSHLTRASTGISMDKAAIQLALNQKPDILRKFSLYSYIQYIELPAEKTVVEVKSPDELLMEQGVVFAHIFVDVGDVIQPITHSGVRPACVIVQANSIAELQLLAQKHAQTLKGMITLR